MRIFSKQCKVHLQVQDAMLSLSILDFQTRWVKDFGVGWDVIWEAYVGEVQR